MAILPFSETSTQKLHSEPSTCFLSLLLGGLPLTRYFICLFKMVLTSLEEVVLNYTPSFCLGFAAPIFIFLQEMGQ